MAILPSGINGGAAIAAFTKAKSGQSDEAEGVSYLGGEYYDSVTFGGLENGSPVKYTDQDGNIIEVEPITFITCLVSASLQNNIVKTALQGGSTITEFISTENWKLTFDINIDTGELDNVNKYPREQVVNTLLAFKSTEGVAVTSKHLNDVLGVSDVVFHQIDIPQIEGQRNVQPIRVIAESIENEEVRLTLEE